MLASLSGDKPAYEKLLMKVSGMVRGYLMNTMGSARSEENVEDLVQDVLIAIHKKKQLYRQDMPILPWLFAIARYRLIDHIRAEKRRPLLAEWDETLDPAAPETIKLSDERLFELEEALEDLPERHKQILILAKAEGIPLSEIAERFNMSLSAVKVTVHRALKSVRNLYPNPDVYRD